MSGGLLHLREAERAEIHARMTGQGALSRPEKAALVAKSVAGLVHGE